MVRGKLIWLDARRQCTRNPKAPPAPAASSAGLALNPRRELLDCGDASPLSPGETCLATAKRGRVRALQNNFRSPQINPRHGCGNFFSRPKKSLSLQKNSFRVPTNFSESQQLVEASKDFFRASKQLCSLPRNSFDSEEIFGGSNELLQSPRQLVEASKDFFRASKELVQPSKEIF